MVAPDRMRFGLVGLNLLDAKMSFTQINCGGNGQLLHVPFNKTVSVTSGNSNLYGVRTHQSWFACEMNYSVFWEACTPHTFVPHTHPLTKYKHWLHFPRNLLLLVVFICMLKVDHNWNSSLPFVSVSASFSADFTMACICSVKFFVEHSRHDVLLE